MDDELERALLAGQKSLEGRPAGADEPARKAAIMGEIRAIQVMIEQRLGAAEKACDQILERLS